MIITSVFVLAPLLAAYLQFSEAYHSSRFSREAQFSSSSLRSTTDERIVVATEKEVPYDIESWRGGYKTCKKEIVEALEENFPDDLEGTYFRNGFGKFESGKVPILHPFDADGMVAAVTMKVIKCWSFLKHLFRCLD